VFLGEIKNLTFGSGRLLGALMGLLLASPVPSNPQKERGRGKEKHYKYADILVLVCNGEREHVPNTLGRNKGTKGLRGEK